MQSPLVMVRIGMVAALILGLGVAAGHFLGRSSRLAVEAEQAAVEQRVALLEDQARKLDAAQARIKALTSELATTQDALAAALAPGAATTTVADAEGTAEPPVDPKQAFSDMILKIGHAQLKGQIEGRLGVLNERLQLTPEQETAVKEILEAESAEATAALDRLMSGQGTPADFGRFARLQRGQLPAGIDAALGGPQQAEYAAFQEQERVSSVENRVNLELSGLVSAGGLTPEQKDQAFATISGVVQSEDAVEFESMNDTAEVRAFMDQATEKRLEIMQPILSEPQLRMYQQQVEMGRQVISNLMPAEQP